nr:unnamed protein product [Spirometra erinaceieuropaei]
MNTASGDSTDDSSGRVIATLVADTGDVIATIKDSDVGEQVIAAANPLGSHQSIVKALLLSVAAADDENDADDDDDEEEEEEEGEEEDDDDEDVDDVCNSCSGDRAGGLTHVAPPPTVTREQEPPGIEVALSQLPMKMG